MNLESGTTVVVPKGCCVYFLAVDAVVLLVDACLSSDISGDVLVAGVVLLELP